ncbi:hypothetical protein NMG60_11018788 [Bertholletia excelsa]
MHCSSSFSFTKPSILASFSSNPKPPSHRVNNAPQSTTTTKTTEANFVKPKQKQQKQTKPSIAEIERVIGAGVFRDRDNSNRNTEENKTIFDTVLSNSIGKSEGNVEKKLRETGEWIIDRTEKTSNSAGKNILMAVFLWALPMWFFSFLVAAGIVKLPFSTPFLDDLFM